MITHAEPGRRLKLNDIDPAAKGPYDGKDDPRVAADLAKGSARLIELQDRLMAEGKQSLLVVRARWDDHQEAYEDAIEATSTPEAPWHVVSADRKWARDLAVTRLLIETLERMDPQYPKPSYDQSKIKIER